MKGNGCVEFEAKEVLSYILSGCKIALTQGRYNWHIYMGLRTLVNNLEPERLKTYSNQRIRTATIEFLNEENQ